jgi:hypothetical protein
MTRADRKFLCSALAFTMVMLHEKFLGNVAEGSAQMQKLANLIDSYCTADVPGAPMGNEPSEASIDELAERHMRELRDQGETRLPEDWQMLMRLHHRLLHRQAWRKWRQFYGPDNEAKLADLVLALMDEELNGDGKSEMA